MIEIKNVSKSYNNEVKAVDNISLVFEKGKVLGLLGPNGAGKTTLLKMITGVLESDEGSIYINGVDISKEAQKAKSMIGFVSDNPNLFLKLKGIEFLNFIGNVFRVEKDQLVERIKKYSKLFEIEDNLNEKIESYSHGMRQKIIIISTLIHKPDIWILDEPITGLDPKSSFKLKELMKDYAKNDKCVIFSTHVLEIAEKLCDKIFIINKGKIIFDGSFIDFQKNKEDKKTLEEVFLELTKDE